MTRLEEKCVELMRVFLEHELEYLEGQSPRVSHSVSAVPRRAPLHAKQHNVKQGKLLTIGEEYDRYINELVVQDFTELFAQACGIPRGRL